MNSKVPFTSRWAGVATLLAALALPSAALADAATPSRSGAGASAATNATNAAVQSVIKDARDSASRRQSAERRNKPRHQTN